MGEAKRNAEMAIQETARAIAYFSERDRSFQK